MKKTLAAALIATATLFAISCSERKTGNEEGHDYSRNSDDYTRDSSATNNGESSGAGVPAHSTGDQTSAGHTTSAQ